MKKLNRLNNRKLKKKKGILLAAAFTAISVFAAGCGESSASDSEVSGGDTYAEENEEAVKEEETVQTSEIQEEVDEEESSSESAEPAGETGIANETAVDAEIDFEALQAENSEIFGWLHIPDTSIDAPILQSAEGDDYYETHNALKEEDEGGALYIEAANLSSMCDFNTVIHGRTSEGGESGLFADLYRFADPDFFDSHEQVYVYLDGNVLTYEVFAAFERENTSLIRTYDFTYIAGCSQFLEDVYNIREMSMMIRSGWEDVTPYHFLITLTTSRPESPDKQFVVLAALINDPAGNIDRAVVE